MIKEAYCSFEVAKLLKEKGFKEEVTNYYDSGGNFVKSGYKFNYNFQTVDHSAPTHQMAMAWLREYKIYIMIDRSWSMKDSWQYCICVNNDFDHLIQQDSIPNRTYEEAVEAALKYVLENLI